MDIGPDKPWFTQRELFELTLHGRDNKAFQIWLQRGHIEVQDSNPGRGNIRKLSFCECLELKAFSELLYSGERPGYAKRMARFVSLRAREIFERRQWDLENWETEDGFSWCVIEISSSEGRSEDDDGIAGRFIPKDRLPEFLHRAPMYLRLLDVDYLIWGLWHVIDQQLPNSRVPWRIGQPDKPADAGACDESGNPIDPDHPWNKERNS